MTVEPWTMAGRFRVTNEGRVHWVDLNARGGHDVQCDCGHHIWKGVKCRHIKACEEYQSSVVR